MKKFYAAVLIGLVLLLTIAGVAYAITNGTPDNGRHPYVGLLVFDSAPGAPAWRCSGALISSTVVLTAGHCTNGAVAARFWTNEDMTYGNVPFPLYPYGGPGSGAVEGTAYTNPSFESEFLDVGIVVLTEPIEMAKYAELPAPGLVDTLANKTPVDLVGYGVSEQIMTYPGESPRDRWTGPRLRLYAPSELISGNFSISADFLRLALNPGGGSGGTCFGDSGGPDLLGGTNTVLGVNSYVTNVNCTGVGYSHRVDIPEVLVWIKSFMQ